MKSAIEERINKIVIKLKRIENVDGTFCLKEAFKQLLQKESKEKVK